MKEISPDRHAATGRIDDAAGFSFIWQ